jgi:hypothetical protein
VCSEQQLVGVIPSGTAIIQIVALLEIKALKQLPEHNLLLLSVWIKKDGLSLMRLLI